jgi:hypothetical protein
MTYVIHATRGLDVTKSSKTLGIVAIAAAVLVTGIFVARDLFLRHPTIMHCPDGSHPTIDIRDFTTQYWAYSVKLEASVADKAKVSAELDPKTLEQISQAFQRHGTFANTWWRAITPAPSLRRNTLNSGPGPTHWIVSRRKSIRCSRSLL